MIFDGGRWDRIRSWGYWWKWERNGWRVWFDSAFYSLPLPSVYTAANGPADPDGAEARYSVTFGATLGTRSLADPVMALEITVPVARYRVWLWLYWLLPNGMEGKRAFRDVDGRRWPSTRPI